MCDCNHLSTTIRVGCRFQNSKLSRTWYTHKRTHWRWRIASTDLAMNNSDKCFQGTEQLVRSSVIGSTTAATRVNPPPPLPPPHAITSRHPTDNGLPQHPAQHKKEPSAAPRLSTGALHWCCGKRCFVGETCIVYHGVQAQLRQTRKDNERLTRLHDVDESVSYQSKLNTKTNKNRDLFNVSPTKEQKECDV